MKTQDTDLIGKGMAKLIAHQSHSSCPCPDDAMMAALLEHKLTGQKQDLLFRHITFCDECSEVFDLHLKEKDVGFVMKKKQLWVGIAASLALFAVVPAYQSFFSGEQNRLESFQSREIGLDFYYQGKIPRSMDILLSMESGSKIDKEAKLIQLLQLTFAPLKEISLRQVEVSRTVSTNDMTIKVKNGIVRIYLPAEKK